MAISIHVPPLGFAGQAQTTNATKAAHYGTGRAKSSGTKRRRAAKKKPAGARKKRASGKPKVGTKAWMTHIRGLRGKGKKKTAKK